MKTFSLLGKVPAALFLSCTLLMTSCHSNRKLVGTGSFKAVSDSIWTSSLSNPDGFTMDIITMREPAEGVVVAYAATQGNTGLLSQPK